MTSTRTSSCTTPTSCGDKVACRYTVTGAARKTGEPLTVPGITILHFRDGRCIERWDFEGTEANVS